MLSSDQQVATSLVVDTGDVQHIIAASDLCEDERDRLSIWKAGHRGVKELTI